MKWLRVLLYALTCGVVFIAATSLTIRFLLQDESSVICPDVVGLDVEEAKVVAAQRGLSLIITKYEKKPDVPYDRILVQTPDPALLVRVGRTVSVVVSDGPRTVTIPSYLGLSLEEAQAALADKGIACKRIIYVPSDNVGKVVAQMPQSGDNILDQAGMSFFVGAREKRFFVMPDIRSEEYGAAIEEMEKKQIKYAVAPAGSLGWIKGAMPSTIPPKTVFDEDQVVEVRMVNEGSK
jgi:eukaryotic-like serine/threonine-protein kinase